MLASPGSRVTGQGGFVVIVARVTAGLLLLVSTAYAQEVPPPATQIAGAVIAAPEDRRAGAKVLGWDAAGKNVTLREGSNDQVCLADNPKVEGFNVACYHKDLDAFMARGRELTAQGITDARHQEPAGRTVVDGRRHRRRPHHDQPGPSEAVTPCPP
jgi:hypothetical protein